MNLKVIGETEEFGRIYGAKYSGDTQIENIEK